MGQQEGKQIGEGFWKIETSELRFETMDTGEWYSRQWRVEKTTTKKKKQKARHISDINNHAPSEFSEKEIVQQLLPN